jgi:hypothetical protein
MDKASELMAAKTLTISRLMAIAPPGTIDPTPHLYDTTMYTMGGLMAVAVIAHGLVRPLKVITPPATAISSSASAALGAAAEKMVKK